jgi:hypothetical protein
MKPASAAPGTRHKKGLGLTLRSHEDETERSLSASRRGWMPEMFERARELMVRMKRLTAMNAARRLPRPLTLGAVIVVIGVAAVAVSAFVARLENEPYMPTVTPGATAPAGATTTTGMSAVGIVGARLGERVRTLIVNLAACNAERNAVDIGEDGSRVLLYARTTGGGDGFCSDAVTVSLGQELGQRTVIDGSSGQPLTVEAR